MIRKFIREYYLLPPWEQRAILLLSLLVMCTLGVRLLYGSKAEREPAGYEGFQEEVRAIIMRLEEQDSLDQLKAATGLKSFKLAETANALKKPVQLNAADSATLIALPGIGPVFAGRIVKYRSLLGGYCRVGQLAEVYGLRQETLERISPLLLIDSASWARIPLNHCEFRELLRHPYLEYTDVLALVRYIDQEGEIDSMGEIRINVLLADSVAERIEPYLDFSF